MATFTELINEMNGYECKTTLWDDLDEYCLDRFDGEDKEYYFKWTD